MFNKKAIAIAFALYFFPVFAHAQSFTDFKSVVFYIVGILNQVIVLIIGIAVLVFLYGVLKYVGAGDDTEKMKSGRNFIIFGIIGIFIMVSVWGLVYIITNTFKLDNSKLPEPRNIPQEEKYIKEIELYIE